MSASASQDDRAPGRIMCSGDDLYDLIHGQCGLDRTLGVVTITIVEEANAALEAESAFDVIILDQRLDRIGTHTFMEQLRRHSPDAERLIVVDRVDMTISDMLENDCRVMRLLRAPVAADVLCDAVADALLRHRARALRATALPRVTPMGGNPCCTALAKPA